MDIPDFGPIVEVDVPTSFPDPPFSPRLKPFSKSPTQLTERHVPVIARFIQTLVARDLGDGFAYTPAGSARQVFGDIEQLKAVPLKDAEDKENIGTTLSRFCRDGPVVVVDLLEKDGLTAVFES